MRNEIEQHIERIADDILIKASLVVIVVLTPIVLVVQVIKHLG